MWGYFILSNMIFLYGSSLTNVISVPRVFSLFDKILEIAESVSGL